MWIFSLILLKVTKNFLLYNFIVAQTHKELSPESVVSLCSTELLHFSGPCFGFWASNLSARVQSFCSHSVVSGKIEGGADEQWGCLAFSNSRDVYFLGIGGDQK